jgi:hypothetical protein
MSPWRPLGRALDKSKAVQSSPKQSEAVQTKQKKYFKKLSIVGHVIHEIRLAFQSGARGTFLRFLCCLAVNLFVLLCPARLRVRVNSMFMNRLCSIIITAAVAAAFCGCNIHISNSSGGWNSSSLSASTNIFQSAAIPAGIKSLEVINAFGAVHVTGADIDPAPGWSQNLTVRARTEADAQEIATNFLCRAELSGDHLKLIVSEPDLPQPHSFQSDLEITVPKSVAVQTRDKYGRTEIAGLNGDVEAVDQFGAMTLHDIGGNVRAQTSYAALDVRASGPATLKNQFGAIQAADIRGPLEAQTSYGPLEARDIGGTLKLRNQFGLIRVQKAGQADVETSYGEMVVKQIDGDARLVNSFGRVAAEDVSGSVNAKTSYGPMDITGPGANFTCDNSFGPISLRATSGALARVDAHTSYAALDVRLPASLKPSVQAHTSYGHIDSDFPSDSTEGAPRLSLRNAYGNIRVARE